MSIAIVGIGFGAMLALMFLSVPIAVTILSIGALGGYMLYGTPLVEMMGGVIWTSLNSPTMLAIPLFMMLGELLLRGGIADRMYDAMAVWLGRLPGGLLHSNIATCTMFSATSGSSVATAATVGTIALPALEQYKYPMPASLGSLAAGGTLGILIRPRSTCWSMVPSPIPRSGSSLLPVWCRGCCWRCPSRPISPSSTARRGPRRRG